MSFTDAQHVAHAVIPHLRPGNYFRTGDPAPRVRDTKAPRISRALRELRRDLAQTGNMRFGVRCGSRFYSALAHDDTTRRA
jgi:hypothetical protein